jgi:hypothetical protein
LCFVQNLKRTAKETLAMAKEMQSGNFAMSSLKVSITLCSESVIISTDPDFDPSINK